MDYSQVILEMLTRIQKLESEVGALKARLDGMQTPAPRVDLGKVSPKYKKLAAYLLAQNGKDVSLSYSQIEQILGFALPETAQNFKQSYWANTKTHSYASSWMAVGYKAYVDVDNDIVTFVKNLF